MGTHKRKFNVSASLAPSSAAAWQCRHQPVARRQVFPVNHQPRQLKSLRSRVFVISRTRGDEDDRMQITRRYKVNGGPAPFRFSGLVFCSSVALDHRCVSIPPTPLSLPPPLPPPSPAPHTLPVFLAVVWSTCRLPVSLSLPLSWLRKHTAVRCQAAKKVDRVVCCLLSVPAPCHCILGTVCLLVGCLTSQQHASVSQGRTCEVNFTCCHIEIKFADQTFHLTQSQYTDTGPTSPSTDPITPGAWQGSHWSA